MAHPLRVELVPGGLSIAIWACDVTTPRATTPCWIFLSDGLASRGQRDMAVFVPGAAAADPRSLGADAFKLFLGMFDLSGRGERLDAGHFLEITSGSTGGLTGIGLSDSRFFDDFGIPAGTLVGFPLLGDEIAAAKSFGLSRIMARIGNHHRYYPCLPIWDLTRPSVGARAGNENSILHRLPNCRVTGISATRRPDCAVIRVETSMRDGLKEILANSPGAAVFALLTPPNPDADGLLMWEPGQSHMIAITPPH